MSYKQLDSRTIVSDSFAPFGEFQPLPDRPDESAEERDRKKAADRTPMPDVLRLMGGWSVEQLDSAIATRGFPRPLGYRQSGWPWMRREPFYSFTAIQRWHAKEIEFLKSLPRELKR